MLGCTHTKIDIIQSIFSNHNGTKSEINSKSKTGNCLKSKLIAFTVMKQINSFYLAKILCPLETLGWVMFFVFWEISMSLNFSNGRNHHGESTWENIPCVTDIR